jgi:hypothetical protein
MLFNSLHFLVFFPLVVMAYCAMPWRWRWVLLLAASYYFYAAWRPEYLVLIIASTLVDYVCGLGMGRFAAGRIRQAPPRKPPQSHEVVLSYRAASRPLRAPRTAVSDPVTSSSDIRTVSTVGVCCPFAGPPATNRMPVSNSV